MKTLQNLLNKYVLFAVALCMTMSGVSCACDDDDNADNTIKIEFTPSSDIDKDNVGTMKLKKTAGSTILGDVHMKLANHEKFVKENGDALKETMTLSEFLGRPEEDKLEDEELEMKIKAAQQTKTANKTETLRIAIGTSADTAAYVSETDAVKWKHDPSGIQFSAPTITPDTNPISGDTQKIIDVSITVTAPSSTTLTYSNLQINWGDLAAFEAVALNSDGTTEIGNLSNAATATFAALVGKNDTDKITSGTHTFKVRVNASATTQSGPDDKTLTFSITKGADTCVTDTEVVKWKTPVDINLTMSHIANPKEEHHGAAVFSFKKTSGNIKFSEVKLHWENGDSFVWEDPSDHHYKKLSELTTLGQLLKKGGKITNEDMVMNGNDYAITLNIKASKAALNANANVELKCSLGDAANHELYAASQTIAKWEHSADFGKKVKNIKRISAKIIEEDKLLKSLENGKGITKKEQNLKELDDIINPLEKLKNLGEINGANVSDAIQHINDILLETGDFVCKTQNLVKENKAGANKQAFEKMIKTASSELEFDMDVDFKKEDFRKKHHSKCLDNKWITDSDSADTVCKALLNIAGEFDKLQAPSGVPTGGGA